MLSVGPHTAAVAAQLQKCPLLEERVPQCAHWGGCGGDFYSRGGIYAARVRNWQQFRTICFCSNLRLLTGDIYAAPTDKIGKFAEFRSIPQSASLTAPFAQGSLFAASPLSRRMRPYRLPPKRSKGIPTRQEPGFARLLAGYSPAGSYATPVCPLARKDLKFDRDTESEKRAGIRLLFFMILSSFRPCAGRISRSPRWGPPGRPGPWRCRTPPSRWW